MHATSSERSPTDPQIDSRRGDKEEENVRSYPTLLDDKKRKKDTEPKAHMHEPEDHADHEDHIRHHFMLCFGIRCF